jgi:hypothetical protein
MLAPFGGARVRRPAQNRYSPRCIRGGNKQRVVGERGQLVKRHANICLAVPSNNLPQPQANSVSPQDSDF